MNTVDRIQPLLAYLAAGGQSDASAWQGWRIRRIGGGGNNLLYRATGDAADLAVKFTVRDERDRAGREFAALAVLRRAGLVIGPEPVLLERDRYPAPVVVQTWLAGEVEATPPATDAGWQRWLEHLVTVHSVTSVAVPARLSAPVLTMTAATDGLTRLQEQLAFIPPVEQPPDLRDLVRRVAATAWPTWPSPSLTLCHGDTNIRNIIRRSGPWAAVDWEYSGWGDPAFEIATLVTHAAHVGVAPERWAWVIDTYAALSPDAGVGERTRVYVPLMLVWWVARCARILYEWPRGADRRLAERPVGWQADIEAKYHQYLALAARWLP